MQISYPNRILKKLIQKNLKCFKILSLSTYQIFKNQFLIIALLLNKKLGGGLIMLGGLPYLLFMCILYIQWIPLNVGTLGPALFAHIKWLPIKTEICKKKKKN